MDLTSFLSLLITLMLKEMEGDTVLYCIVLSGRLIIVTLLQWYNFRTARSGTLRCIRLGGGCLHYCWLSCSSMRDAWAGSRLVLASSDGFLLPSCYGGTIDSTPLMASASSAAVVQSSLWWPSSWCLQFVNPSSRLNEMTAVWCDRSIPRSGGWQTPLASQRLQTHGAYKILPRTPA